MDRTIVLGFGGQGRLALREGVRLAPVCRASAIVVAMVDPVWEVFGGGVEPVPVPSDSGNDVPKIFVEGIARLSGRFV